MKIVECVPNFSEGRRKEVIQEITGAAMRTPGVALLDSESDPNHNRMVLTFVGSPEAVKLGALNASAKAIELIDLTKHQGEHPRMGAVDVVPFVPLREVTIEECVEIANSFAREYSERFEVPVFLYEAAARKPERRNLANVREGQFEGLRELIGKEPSREPDYGPNRIHPTAGATAVGARQILIAYNVNLKTMDHAIAKKIAKRIRERDGGLPAVKALGFELKDRGLVQVSMNLTDYTKTSMHTAYDKVSELADEAGVKVVESEIVGLVPLDALTRASIHYLKLKEFKSSQVIENRLYDIGIEKRNSLTDLSLEEFSSRVAGKEPVPGGGSVSAYCGALAASLVVMVCRLTIGKKGYESVQEKVNEILSEASDLQKILLSLVVEDADAYALVLEAYKLPKDTEQARIGRDENIAYLLKKATEVPMKTASFSYRVLLLAKEIRSIGNKNAFSDAVVSVELSKAAVRGASSNVKINLLLLENQAEFVSSTEKKLSQILSLLD